MDIEGGFNQQDSEGFIRINATRLMAHHAIMRRKHLYWKAEPTNGGARPGSGDAGPGAPVADPPNGDAES